MFIKSLKKLKVDEVLDQNTQFFYTTGTLESARRKAEKGPDYTSNEESLQLKGRGKRMKFPKTFSSQLNRVSSSSNDSNGSVTPPPSPEKQNTINTDVSTCTTLETPPEQLEEPNHSTNSVNGMLFSSCV